MNTRRRILLVVAIAACLLDRSAARAQITAGTDVNLSQMGGYQSECAIAKNPANHDQLFALCNNLAGPGLFAARSVNGGLNWTFPDAADKTIADGDANQGPAACCDPTLAWDDFGNLFITYIDQARTGIVTILSTDGGATFANLVTFPPASVDQPTVVAGSGEVWIVWNQSGQMVARGAPVTGLGAANIGAFHALQTIPGTANCSFGDIAIAPGGAVVQTCETENSASGEGQESILVNTDADGLGAGNFGAAVTATTTNVGPFDAIPPQASRTVDAEAGLAFDANPASPHFGRLYLVYTEEPVDESNDTQVLLRFSGDNGGTWSNPPVRVDDDATGRSQFFPKIASNPLSGNVGVCWYDARNSATNTAMQVFCTIANRDFFPAFIGPNVQISDGASTSSANPNQFGDYSGLAYFQGAMHPIWGDTSNSGGLNPNGTTEFDAYTDRITGNPATNEGDPHITTVEGIHYDFQSAGEFVALRDGDGMEIQTRQTPIPTASVVGNAYTGLTTCVSLNTAVAARVGSHRVSFEPNVSGVPDPSGLQLRVDGNLTTLPAYGLDLGSGGRVASSPGGGIEIDFPDETVLIVTPGWWASQELWYLNVDVFQTPAVQGIMGIRAPGSWLPALADGSSLGPKPAALHDRFVELNEKFADSWRVTDKTSLFDYAPGTSAATFGAAGWPPENPPCVLPHTTPVKPVSAAVARELCRAVTTKNRNADCVFDVRVTGNRGFVKTYLLSQKVHSGSTFTAISDDRDPTRVEEPVTFTATVARRAAAPRPRASARRAAPRGTVEFLVDGVRAGTPVRLDARGQARWKTAELKPGEHRVAARFLPARGSGLLGSGSEKRHVVKERTE